jgi:hypothetical protein
LTAQAESGMGYHVVTVQLASGARYKQAVVIDGNLTRIRGFDAIPFAEPEIVNLEVTHDTWDWQTE